MQEDSPSGARGETRVLDSRDSFTVFLQGECHVELH